MSDGAKDSTIRSLGTLASEGPAKGGAHLVFRSGAREGEVLELKKGEVTLGRDRRNDVELADDTVSGFHTRLTRDAQGVFWVEDRGSKNGTFLRGQRIEREALVDGDVFRICKLGPEIEYRDADASAGTRAEADATRVETASRIAAKSVLQSTSDRRRLRDESSRLTASGVREILHTTLADSAGREKRFVYGLLGVAAASIAGFVGFAWLMLSGSGGVTPAADSGAVVAGASASGTVASLTRHGVAPTGDGERWPAVGAELSLRPEFLPIYGSLYFTYRSEGNVGTVAVVNETDRPLAGARLRFRFADRNATLLVEPFQREVPVVPPGGEQVVEITPKLSEEILADSNRQVGVIVSLEHGGTILAEEQRAVLVHRRDVFNWEDPRRIAIFVDPDDRGVYQFIREIFRFRAETGGREFPPPNIARAVTLLTALAEFDIAYEEDARNPLAAAMDRKANDRVKFPVRTFLSGFGDCDDLSVLCCSLLEALRVPTAFAVGNGHVLLLFDSGVRSEDLELTPFDRETVVAKGGRVWIPVEATDLTRRGASFASAWAAGWRRREAIESGEMVFVEVHEAWEKYVPMNQPVSAELAQELRERFDAWDPTRLPGGSTLAAQIEAGMDGLRQHFSKNLAGRVAQIERTIPEGLERQQAIGMLFARSGLYREGRAVFARVLFGTDAIPGADELAGRLDAWGADIPEEERVESKAVLLSNLAMCLGLGARSDADRSTAAELTRSAIDSFPPEAEVERSELMLRLALIYRLRGDLSEEKRWLATAVGLDPSLRSVYDGLVEGDGSVSGPEEAVREYLHRAIE